MMSDIDSLGKIKFWSVLAIGMLATCIVVLLIDMSIKASILEQSSDLRRVIENERSERFSRQFQRMDNETDNNGHRSSDVVDIIATRLETGDAD